MRTTMFLDITLADAIVLRSAESLADTVTCE